MAFLLELLSNFAFAEVSVGDEGHFGDTREQDLVANGTGHFGADSGKLCADMSDSDPCADSRRQTTRVCCFHKHFNPVSKFTVYVLLYRRIPTGFAMFPGRTSECFQ